ncbi:MAG: sigma-70 family RNA polymerase sigma factor [Myxococcales bacterium]|nr:sigma-70 family RNA polymerase sigma factor [Myxococcales bacterium]
MSALARGEVEALAPLYRRYGPDVTRVLRRSLRGASVQEADDLAHEVFVVLLDTAHRYQHQDRLRAWLLGIAVRLARNHVRTRRSRARTLATLTPRRGTDADATLQQLDARQRVDIALDSLSESDREVLLLSVVDGLSGAEIAHALQLTPGAVYVRLHRARKRVAAALRQADEGGRP